jgi:hypothetical protein
LIIDPSDLEEQSLYKLLIGSVVPRPIAWTSTMSREGTLNLAPYSFFTVASRNKEVFEAYVEHFPGEALKEGQIEVMDNLGAHKSERVKELIERGGCELLYLPPYSPDYNPIVGVLKDQVFPEAD